MKYLKEIKKEIIYILFFILCYTIFLNAIGFKHSLWFDYAYQHVRFIQYLILNFKQTHDFFPQLNMNFGMGQNFVNMYYYGMYNPYIIIFQIFNFVPIKIVINLINTSIITMTFAFSYILFRKNKINIRLAKVAAFLAICSLAIFREITVEIMYIYYVPFMFLHLISIHRLIECNKKILFIFSLTMVFFTNFFFAPIVSVVSFIYYILTLKEKKQFNVYNIGKYFIYYLIACLIGMLILIPNFLFYLEGGRKYEVQRIAIKLINAPHDIFLYITEVSIVGIIGIVGSIYLNKKYKIIALFCLALFTFPILNYLMNVCQYVNPKVYIYLLPFIILLFIKVVSNNKKLNLIILISTLLTILLSSNIEIIILLIFINTSLYFYNKKQKTIFLYIIILIVFLLSYSYTDGYITTEQYDGEVLLSLDDNQKSEFEPYRELGSDKTNDLNSIYNFSIPQYTSLVNGNYTSFVNEVVSVENYIPSMVGAATLKNLYNNMYLENYLGAVDKYEKANPIFYGVGNDDIYDIQKNKLTPIQRTVALNQGIFINDSKYLNKYQSNFNLEKVYTKHNIDVNIIGSIDYEFKVPKKYQEAGMYIVHIKNNTPKKEQSDFKSKLIINNHEAFANAKQYPFFDNDYNYTFLINSEDVQKFDILFQYTGNPFNIDIDAYWQSEEDFEQKKLKVIKPEILKVDLNHSYEFTINMDENGYLASTIPYDSGFTIYVDDQEAVVTKVNDSFLGTELKKGKHTVVIKYNIPGFRLGMLFTTCGIGITIILYIKERKINNSNS